MSLESYFNELMNLVLPAYPSTVTSNQLIQSIDLTLLDKNASIEAFTQLKYRANKHQVAALCVYPQHLQHFSTQNSIKLATVINFPQGDEPLNHSLRGIEQAIKLGVDEIDYVLPYQEYLQGQQSKTLKQCEVIAQFCKQNDLILKIIVETGAFPDMQSIYTISKELITIGCDFIKTSTGKISLGASLSAAFAILSAIRDAKEHCCGIKVSGGVKSRQDANNYARLAELMLAKPVSKHWFRIGSSSLIEALKQPDV